ncbi:hypothetical protein [Nocardioides sp. TF02-7]|uniref:hypothetical protein n=1 Tax=Nocardioides sp. TF02-7 TaxID=2917724 RepID=UPI001F06847F|nr:hypothetical protein [Nocardioides sp. TF02-7]UMG94173.1 hypothetical protein MF408_09140 [Nocardioides sp. TF02-7]
MGLRKKKTLLDQAEEYVGTAIDHAREFVDETARPAIADAKDKAAPKVSAGATAVKTKAAPVVAAGATTLAEKAGEAKAYADMKTAELSGKKTKKKRSKVKTLLLVGVLGAVAAFVAKKLQGGGDDGWQSSYDPAPAPGAAETGPPPTDATVGEPAPGAGADASAAEQADPLTDPLPPGDGAAQRLLTKAVRRRRAPGARLGAARRPCARPRR